MEFLPPEVFDHCPLLIYLEEIIQTPPKPFKIFNYWTKHQEFLRIVEESWKVPSYGDPISILHRKLKKLKVILRDFNKSHFGGISNRVDAKRKELVSVQLSILNAPSDHKTYRT